MPFDVKKFTSADLHRRTAEVKCPELKDYFGPDQEPVFKIRGLTGEEFYQVREAVQRRKDIKAIASRLLSGSGEDVANALQQLYGEIPDEYARRVEVIIYGCQEPTLDRPTVIKLFNHFAATMHSMADEILRLTGEGSTLGEPKGSGETPASAMTST